MAAVNESINATVSAVDTAAEELHVAIKASMDASNVYSLQYIASHPVIFFFAIIVAGLILSYVFVFLCKTVSCIIDKR